MLLHMHSLTILSPLPHTILNRRHLDIDLANRIFHNFGTFAIYYGDGCSIPHGSDTNLHVYSFLRWTTGTEQWGRYKIKHCVCPWHLSQPPMDQKTLMIISPQISAYENIRDITANRHQREMSHLIQMRNSSLS